MLNNTRGLLASAACVLVLAACNSGQSKQGPTVLKEDVAATVNGEAVSEKLLGMMLKQRSDLGHPIDAEVRKTYLDRLAMQLAVVQEAQKKGIDKRPEIAAKLELGRQSMIVNAFVEDYFKNNPISDEELKAEYEKLKAEEGGSEYKAHHILVESEAEAKQIIAKLNKNPKLFSALAQEKSKDAVSKSNGGDLGWFAPKRMVPEFSAAVAKLGKGKITQEPVKSKFGYHVIMLDDFRPLTVIPFEQYKERLKPKLEQEKLQKLLDEIKAKAKIEIAQKP